MIWANVMKLAHQHSKHSSTHTCMQPKGACKPSPLFSAHGPQYSKYQVLILSHKHLCQVSYQLCKERVAQLFIEARLAIRMQEWLAHLRHLHIQSWRVSMHPIARDLHGSWLVQVGLRCMSINTHSSLSGTVQGRGGTD